MQAPLCGELARNDCGTLAYIITTTENVATAAQLAFALTHNGGIPNSFVQLVRADEGRLKRLADGLASIAKSKMGAADFGCLNDIEYIDVAHPAFPDDLVSVPADGFAYKLRVRPYSGMGGTEVDYKITSTTFGVPTPPAAVAMPAAAEPAAPAPQASGVATVGDLDGDDDELEDDDEVVVLDAELIDDKEDDDEDDDDSETEDNGGDNDNLEDVGARARHVVLTGEEIERLKRQQQGLEGGAEGTATAAGGDAAQADPVLIRGGERQHWIAPVSGMVVVGCNHLASILGPRDRLGAPRNFNTAPRPRTHPERKDVVQRCD